MSRDSEELPRKSSARASRNGQRWWPRKLNGKQIRQLLILSLLLIGAYIAGQKFLYSLQYVETDDAYVTGHPHQVSARIVDVVQAILVDDNDCVQKGQLIIKLDPHDYLVALAKAEANWATAERNVKVTSEQIQFAETKAAAKSEQSSGKVASALATIKKDQAAVNASQEQIDINKAELEEADAQLVRAKLDYDRYVHLEARGVISTHERDAAVRDYNLYKSGRTAAERKIKQSLDQLEETKSALKDAQAMLTQSYGDEQDASSYHVEADVDRQRYRVAQAAAQEAQAEVDDAHLRLSYCNIYAPVSGRIGKRTVEVGHRIEPGQELLSVVEDYAWVVANYKETQLKHIVPGQRAQICVDSIPNHIFQGVIDSFSPGAGGPFSLIPPDNAIGNFTKIVQRIPVKIRLDKDSVKGYEDRLAIGESAIVDTDLKHKCSAAELAQLRNLDLPTKKVWIEPGYQGYENAKRNN